MLPCDVPAAALAADCKADSPRLTGTTTGELLPAAESNDDVLILDVLALVDDCCKDGGRIDGASAPMAVGSPRRCPADDKNGAASGKSDESAAPLRPVSYAEPKMNKDIEFFLCFK